MATIKQINANRLNSQKSTGPRSVEGKAASRFNALKHGIDAESEVILNEDPARLAELTAALHGQYQPATPMQTLLVDSLVHHSWLLRRHRTTEALVFEGERRRMRQFSCDPLTNGEVFANHTNAFVRMQRRIDCAERNLHRSLDELRRQQSEPPPVTESAPELQPASPQPDQTKAQTQELTSFRPQASSPGPQPPAPKPGPCSSVRQAPSPLPQAA